MYNYKCEYCPGIVKEQSVKKEVFKHRSGFVMLENLPVGICDSCGYRYYHSAILKKVDDIAKGKQSFYRTESVPVASFA